MIDFPASPTLGQSFVDPTTNLQWVWDGTKWVASGLATPPLPIAMNDNRIINGDMRIDQRWNGSSGTATGYTIDRWAYAATQAAKGTWQRYSATGVLAAFPYALSFVSSSAYAVVAGDSFGFHQAIEADMVSDFQWGTASAQPVTLSFWATSSLIGVFGGSVANAAGSRSYPFSFSLPTANTWTKISITIPGDTAGTWAMSGNATGVIVYFDLGTGTTYRGPVNTWASANYVGVTGSVSVVSTNGATFYVTGVKLEIGSVATPYNRQSLAKSMADCQRYYQGGRNFNYTGYNVTGQPVSVSQQFPVFMRASPTIVVTPTASTNITSPTVTPYSGQDYYIGGTVTATGTFTYYGTFTASAEL